MQIPFKIESNPFVQRLIAKLEVHCQDCGAIIPRGDLATHQSQFCPKQKATESSEMEDSAKVTSSHSTASGGIDTRVQLEEKAIGDITRVKLSSSQLELTSKATHDCKSLSAEAGS